MNFADVFDTLIYFSMNIVMLALVSLDMVAELLEYVKNGVHLVRTGYRWGFVGNIN